MLLDEHGGYGGGRGTREREEVVVGMNMMGGEKVDVVVGMEMVEICLSLFIF